MNNMKSTTLDNKTNELYQAQPIKRTGESIKYAAFGLALMAGIGLSSPAYAEEPKPVQKTPTPVSKTDKPDVLVERGKGGKKVYRIQTSFVIEGRIQKPNAFYVLERSQINYGWAELKKSFLPKILESVRKHPF